MCQTARIYYFFPDSLVFGTQTGSFHPDGLEKIHEDVRMRTTDNSIFVSELWDVMNVQYHSGVSLLLVVVDPRVHRNYLKYNKYYCIATYDVKITTTLMNSTIKNVLKYVFNMLTSLFPLKGKTINKSKPDLRCFNKIKQNEKADETSACGE